MRLLARIQSRLRRLHLWKKVLLVLLTVELLLHLLPLPINDLTFYQSAIKQRIGFPEDPELFWRLPEGFGSRFRQAKDFRGDLLIYTFGGSITMGKNASTNFSRILEDRLLQDGVQAKVINFGCSGYTTYQALTLCRQACAKRQPQAVILTSSFNDNLPSQEMTDREAGERNRSRATRLLYFANRVKLFAAYRTLLFAIRDALALQAAMQNHRTYTRVPIEDYRENLMAFAALAQAEGFHLYFVTEPMPYTSVGDTLAPYADAMRAIAAASTGTTFIDVRPAFEAYRIEHNIPPQHVPSPTYDELFVDTCCHPSEIGHELYADTIFQSLR